MVSETHTLAANKVNEFRLGFVYTSENQDLFGPRLFEQYGIKGALEAPRIKGFRNSPSPASARLEPRRRELPPSRPRAAAIFPGQDRKDLAASGQLSWVHDRHTIKFGVDLSA